MIIAAVDLSFTGTAVAIGGDKTPVVHLAPKHSMLADPLKAMQCIADWVTAQCQNANVTFIEGLVSYQRNGSGELAGLAYIVRDRLRRAGHPYRDVPPTCIKKFATGNGNAKKDLMMMQVLKRFSIETPTNDAADAVALYHFGRALQGIQTYTKPQMDVVTKYVKDQVKLRNRRLDAATK